MARRNPAITIAMPVYNGENFVEQAIRDILSQDFYDFELIVTDNCSTDRTPAIVTGFAARDTRVRYIRNGSNLGAAGNYNLGLQHARGKYLKWAAHDDRLSPNHLSVLFAEMEADPGLSLAYGRTICIDQMGEPVPMIGEEMPELAQPDAVERFIAAITMAGTCFPIFGLFRTEQLHRSTGHRAYYGSDRALLAEAALMGRFKRAGEAVFYNREHVTRSINIDDKLERSRWQTGSASRTAAAEHLNLARHLWEIAGRHPDSASPMKARAALVARHLILPKQVGRYGLESLTLASPSAGLWVKRQLRKLRGNPAQAAAEAAASSQAGNTTARGSR